MRATRFEAFGDPSVLKLCESPTPEAEVWGTGGDVDFTRDGAHGNCRCPCGQSAPAIWSP